MSAVTAGDSGAFVTQGPPLDPAQDPRLTGAMATASRASSGFRVVRIFGKQKAARGKLLPPADPCERSPPAPQVSPRVSKPRKQFQQKVKTPFTVSELAISQARWARLQSQHSAEPGVPGVPESQEGAPPPQPCHLGLLPPAGLGPGLWCRSRPTVVTRSSGLGGGRTVLCGPLTFGDT